MRKRKCPSKVVIVDKMESNLKMLRPPIENWIASNENDTPVVTVKRSETGDCYTQIWQQLTKLDNLSSGGRHSNVLCLGGGKSNLLLLLALPRDKSLLEKHRSL